MSSAVIRGLKGLTFVDKTDGMKEKVDRVSNCLLTTDQCRPLHNVSYKFIL